MRSPFRSAPPPSQDSDQPFSLARHRQTALHQRVRGAALVWRVDPRLQTPQCPRISAWTWSAEMVRASHVCPQCTWQRTGTVPLRRGARDDARARTRAVRVLYAYNFAFLGKCAPKWFEQILSNQLQLLHLHHMQPMLVCPDSVATPSMPVLKRGSDTGHKAS